MLEAIEKNNFNPKIPVIDANLSFTRRVDPTCLEDCDYEKIEDFNEMREVTGVDIGFSNNSTDIQRMIDTRTYLENNPQAYIVRNSFDLMRATQENLYGALFYCQKHYPVNNNPAVVDDWYNKGLRTQQLAYNAADLPNQSPTELLAGGSDQPEQGVTELGKAVIEGLNRLHMVVDVSHCCPRSVFDAVRLSTDPITANHSNAYTLTPHRRNKTDDELRAIAETGGVIGVTPIRWMLNPEGTEQAGIDDYINHLDYIVDLVGIDHVGVASDARFDGWESTSRHYCDEHMAAPDRWKRVIKKLQSIRTADGSPKYDAEGLAKLFGGNFLRLFQNVMVGLTPPALGETIPVNGLAGITFNWQPSRAIGVPTAKYTLQVATLDNGQVKQILVERDLTRSRHTIALERLPTNARVWWRILAYNDVGSVQSDWEAVTNL
ncbi:MAG: membrane dipeptidase [Candidatus Promineifilaceae bacterium]